MSKKLVLGALLALSVAFGQAYAQDMGGDEKQDEGAKPDAGKDEPKPDAPKPDEPKPDAPKPDAPKTKKSVVFDATPESWKIVPQAHGPVLKALYTIEGADGADPAQVAVIFAGAKGSYEKELDRWMEAVEADGKKIEKSAVKEESFEANGLKVKLAEMSGSMPALGGKRPKKGEKPEKKPGQKLVAACIEGPDGAWVVRLQGGDKTVEKVREDFMKFVKSAKPGDRPVEERRERRKKEPKE